MSVEKHAEALVRYFKETSPPDGLSESEQEAVVVGVIARHMQAAIDDATATLQARNAELKAALVNQNHDVCQTLGKALRYPWFKDDPANFPDATEADGVCTADHVPETLAAEAAKRIAELEARERISIRYVE